MTNKVYTLNQIGDEFNATFKQGKTIGTPALPSPENAKRLFDLLDEEVKELKAAYVNRDTGNFLQEASDIIYVLATEMRLLSLPLDTALSEIHRSNMTKLDNNGNPIVRDDGKILKGENYEYPDMAKVLNGTEELPSNYEFPKYVKSTMTKTVFRWCHRAGYLGYWVDADSWGFYKTELYHNLSTGNLCIRNGPVKDTDLIPATEEEYNAYMEGR